MFDDAYRLATTAFWAGIAGDFDSAAETVQRIDVECGGPGVLLALLAWIDTYVDHVTDGEGAQRLAPGTIFVEASTGRIDEADSARLAPEVRWAGDLIHAGAVRDMREFAHLMLHSGSNEDAGRRVMMVLELVTETIKMLPRGFAKGESGAPSPA